MTNKENEKFQLIMTCRYSHSHIISSWRIKEKIEDKKESQQMKEMKEIFLKRRSYLIFIRANSTFPFTVTVTIRLINGEQTEINRIESSSNKKGKMRSYFRFDDVEGSLHLSFSRYELYGVLIKIREL
jgi:hypothetical protein